VPDHVAKFRICQLTDVEENVLINKEGRMSEAWFDGGAIATAGGHNTANIKFYKASVSE